MPNMNVQAPDGYQGVGRKPHQERGTPTPATSIDEPGEYGAAVRNKRVTSAITRGTADRSTDVNPAPGINLPMPVVSPKKMMEERIRSTTSYKQQRAKKGLEPGYM